jgi:hypothetical protein
MVGGTTRRPGDVMTSVRSAAPRPPPLSNFSPSVAAILRVERKYTGPQNASKTHVASADVKTAIAALGKGVDVEARKTLAGFLFAFGGNSVNPKSEIAPADKKAMQRALIAGIESGDRVAGLPPQVQKGVLGDLIFNSALSTTLGVKTSSGTSPSVVKDPAARQAIQTALKSFNIPDRFGTSPFNSSVSVATRGGKPYGYSVSQTFIDAKGNELGLSLLLNSKGTVVSRSQGISAADHTPED